MTRRKPPPLRAAEKATLRAGSRAISVSNLEWLQRYQLRRKRWIGRSNRYFQREALLRNDSESGTIREKDVALYVAGSSVLHVIDGWSYAGRATEAALRGDAATATHLGYYASLRATMSLLAAEGIGIFNDRHIAILPPPWTSPPILPIARGTHVIAWIALEHWATYVRSGDVIGEVVTPFRIPLREWLSSRPGNQWRPAAREWLLAWGADLRHLARDRDLRNRASYRPQSDSADPAAPAYEFASEMWRLCDPAGAGVFQGLDVELLRNSLEAAFAAQYGRGPVGDRFFADEVQMVLDDTGHAANAQLRTALLRTGGIEDSLVMRFAGRPTQQGSPTAHLEVLARAFLLLRLATGSAATSLRAAGIDRDYVENWWRQLLRQRGIWDGFAGPSLDDLWDDVSDALERAASVAATDPAVSTTEWLAANADSHTRLVGLERVAIGGLLF